MNLNQTFTLLFWKAKSRSGSGLSLLYARITINGRRIEISTNRKVSETLWNAKMQKAIGSSLEAKMINSHLDAIKVALYQHHSRLVTMGRTVTPLLLKNEYLGISENRKTINEAFSFLLKQYEEKLKIAKTSGTTISKYRLTAEKVEKFVKQKFSTSDMLLVDITPTFLNDFFHYLMTVERLSNNTAMKYISRVKTLFLMVHSRGWMKENLAASFRCTYEEENPTRLEMGELRALAGKQFSVARLQEAKDCFVFMCYTGFAYSDVKGLDESCMFKGIDGGDWIEKNRQKTKVSECVPLLPPALEIVHKYRMHPYCMLHNVLLPVKSNQKFNGYLKEIADVCGIAKELSTHAARHTFATTVTLENDIPLETVSKMLGHRSLKTTQRYAKVTNKKISDNMQLLKKKLFC
ncbi:MAG: integrase [Pseudopedobacter saltans]|uniref:Integrase n=1 Tax=Pseudopedobacter saltans TaxID=151895 RepID=A0A2W5EW92_9SPHI|nr:MAG: integrase [Pseudopedobacter saltans]